MITAAQILRLVTPIVYGNRPLTLVILAVVSLLLAWQALLIQVDAGFERVYDDPAASLVTVFSSGGAENNDLPEGSSYRGVTPKALLVTHQDGVTDMAPFDLDWRSYNDPAHNAFFKNPMEIEHRVE